MESIPRISILIQLIPVLSGALSFDVGLDLVIARARILRSDPSRPSGMAIVAASRETIRQIISQLGFANKLVIAVYNGPESHVVSGEMVALESFIAHSKYNGIKTSKLRVSQGKASICSLDVSFTVAAGFHSPSIHPSLPKLQEWLLAGDYLSTQLMLPLFSTAYGTEISSGQRLKSTHWVCCLIQRILSMLTFYSGTSRQGPCSILRYNYSYQRFGESCFNSRSGTSAVHLDCVAKYG